MKNVAVSLFCLTFLAELLNARIIRVPEDKPTIQAGINAALDGDTILVAENTYFENISYRGKAITVASYFLIDGDTAHLSRTIIDGSKPLCPDTASVVSMVSGEDTTSVLCGFTLKGGNGTRFNHKGYPYQGGGGVNILYSGGKIEHNIIRENLVPEPKELIFILGPGIHAFVTGNRTAIIRNNLICNNYYKGNPGCAGGGLSLGGGKILIEGNRISGNYCGSPNQAVGGGIAYLSLNMEGVNPVVCIRNNTISDNVAYGRSCGGGILFKGQNLDLDIQVYNNLICDNEARSGWGGGIEFWGTNRAVVCNNTLVNNQVSSVGKQLSLTIGASKVILFNNILWSTTDDKKSEIYIQPGSGNVLIARYNNIGKSWEGEGNIEGIPGFVKGSFSLAETSMCVDRGVDSLEVEGAWFYAPKRDLYDNPRPATIFDRVDMGAIEWQRITGLNIGFNTAHYDHESLSIFPNPAGNFLNIVLPEPGLYLVEICEMTGRVMQDLELNGSVLKIDISTLHRGVYILKVNTANYFKTSCFIKH